MSALPIVLSRASRFVTICVSRDLGIAGSLLPAEELVVDFLDAAEFGDGLGMVVDAEVDVAVVCAAVAPAIADDEECGGLLAAFVATGGLACGEGVDEADGEISVRGEEGF